MKVHEEALRTTREGALIRRVRESAIPKLSIRQAAARIGMSAENWGYIERGYRPAGRGQPAQPFATTAGTLARMASAIGIPPGRLAGEGGRPDAAVILDEILNGAAVNDTEATRLTAADRDLIARSRETGPVLRARTADVDRQAGWQLLELAALAERLGGPAPDEEENHGS